jgi:hypothetical protein
VQIAIYAYGSAIYGSVSDPADPTLNAIDRFFDFVDRGVEAADRVLNRGEQTAEQQRARRTKREVIDATHVEKPAKKPPPASTSSPSTAIVRKPHFYIVEAVDPKSNFTIYVVTDGGNARTECSTREFAEKILRALEAA